MVESLTTLLTSCKVVSLKTKTDADGISRLKRSEIKELQYIAPIANVPSILDVGILSHQRATSMPHQDVSHPEVQARRASIHWTGNRPLHEYVCLYFNARNKTLYRMLKSSGDVCVISIDPDVVEKPYVIISTGNAASPMSRQIRYNGDETLEHIDESIVYGATWKRDDQGDEERVARIMCAEVLVPDVVEPSLITAIYVPTEGQRKHPDLQRLNKPVIVNERLFFL